MTVEARVAKGIQWLKDNNRLHMIDAAKLDVWDIENCPLGQTGGYWATLKEAVPGYDHGDGYGTAGWPARADRWAYDHGFVVQESGNCTAAYEDLTAEWRKQLGS